MMSHAEAVYGRNRLVLTREQVAEMLEVSPRTVARLVKRGELQVLHIGRLARFRPADVEALLERALKDEGSASTEPLAQTAPATGAREHVPSG